MELTKSTLVLGGLTRIVANVARSLHAHGIPVHGASLGEYRKPVRSRALRSFRYLQDAESDPSSFWNQLENLIAEHNVDTVIPCGDEVLVALLPHDAKLRKLVAYCAPLPALCRTVLDKSATLQLAASCGVPVPKEYAFEDLADAASQESSIAFPLVAKPRSKDSQGCVGVKSIQLQNMDALSAAFAKFPSFSSEFLIQEFIPGTGLGVEVLLHRGETLVCFQHERVREYPIEGGVSVAARSLPLRPAVVHHAFQLLKALNWEGPAMVEFRYCALTSRLSLMEINGRFWGSLALSSRLGFDLPWYVWQIAHGMQPRTPPSYPQGVEIRWLAGDFERLIQSASWMLGRRKTLSSFAGDLYAFARAFAHPVYDAVWCWRDPLTAFDEFARTAAHTTIRLTGKAAKRILSAKSFKALQLLRELGLLQSLRYVRHRSFRTRGASIESFHSVRSVLFVCKGNIIRSPMAMRVFERGVAGTPISVKSAGTDATPNRVADARAVRVAQQFQIPLNEHRAARLTREQVAGADLIVAMDYLNLIRIQQSFPEAVGKIALLGAVEASCAGPIEISDPFDGSAIDVEVCYLRLIEKTEALAARLATNSKREPALLKLELSAQLRRL